MRSAYISAAGSGAETALESALLITAPPIAAAVTAAAAAPPAPAGEALLGLPAPAVNPLPMTDVGDVATVAGAGPIAAALGDEGGRTGGGNRGGALADPMPAIEAAGASEPPPVTAGGGTALLTANAAPEAPAVVADTGVTLGRSCCETAVAVPVDCAVVTDSGVAAFAPEGGSNPKTSPLAGSGPDADVEPLDVVPADSADAVLELPPLAVELDSAFAPGALADVDDVDPPCPAAVLSTPVEVWSVDDGAESIDALTASRVEPPVI